MNVELFKDVAVIASPLIAAYVALKGIRKTNNRSVRLAIFKKNFEGTEMCIEDLNLILSDDELLDILGKKFKSIDQKIFEVAFSFHRKISDYDDLRLTEGWRREWIFGMTIKIARLFDKKLKQLTKAWMKPVDEIEHFSEKWSNFCSVRKRFMESGYSGKDE